MAHFLIPIFAIVETDVPATVDAVAEAFSDWRDDTMAYAWASLPAVRGSVGIMFDDAFRTVEIDDDRAQTESIGTAHPVLIAAFDALREAADTLESAGLDATPQRDALAALSCRVPTDAERADRLATALRELADAARRGEPLGTVLRRADAALAATAPQSTLGGSK